MKYFELKIYYANDLYVKIAIKKSVNFIRSFHFTKLLTNSSLKGLTSLSNILHAAISFSSGYNINQIRSCSVPIIIIDNGKMSTINSVYHKRMR